MAGEKWIYIAGAGLLAWYLISQKKGGGGGVQLSLKSAPVQQGEQLSASSYRIIGKRREGMSYAPAAGSAGQELSFTAPINGKFTRNVLQEGQQLLAEFA